MNGMNYDESRLTVKNVKGTYGMEGRGFLCSVYFDGKKVSNASDYGDGGPVMLDGISKAHLELLNQFTAAYLKAVEGYSDNEITNHCIGAWRGAMVAMAVDRFETNKELKRWCKKETLFRTDDMPEGEYRSIRHPYDAVVAAHIRKIAPGATIVNEMLQ